MEEVIGDLRKMCNEELFNFYSSPNIIRKIKLRRVGREGHMTRMGEKRNAQKVLVRKSEIKRSFGNPRSKR
jgi:hypothetical protein